MIAIVPPHMRAYNIAIARLFSVTIKYTALCQRWVPPLTYVATRMELVRHHDITKYPMSPTKFRDRGFAQTLALPIVLYVHAFHQQILCCKVFHWLGGDYVIFILGLASACLNRT